MQDSIYGNIFAQTLRDQRRALLWWAAGILFVVIVYVGGYRQYADAGMLETTYPEFLDAIMGSDDFTTPAGYLNMVFFTLLGPLLMLLASMFAGARAIAGEEEDGMLDIVLAHPVSRAHLVVERFAALAAGSAWLGLVAWLVVYLAASFAEMDLGFVSIGAASVALAMLGLTLGAVALAIGALTGRRGLALGVTAALALALYLANNLAGTIESLEPIQRVSPYHFYLGGDPLRNGFDLAGLGVLALMSLALLLLAIWGLNRRDVMV